MFVKKLLKSVIDEFLHINAELLKYNIISF